MKKIDKTRRRFQKVGTVIFLILYTVIMFLGVSVGSKNEEAFNRQSAGQTQSALIDMKTIDLPPQPDKQYYDIPLSTELQDYIISVAEQYSVPAEVVIAIIERESSYRPGATGLAGEQGFMQIHPINHKKLAEELGITDFYDPEQNILAGTYLLSKLFAKYDTTEALMCYNCGEAGAKSLWERGITQTDYTVGIQDIIKTLDVKEAEF